MPGVTVIDTWKWQEFVIVTVLDNGNVLHQNLVKNGDSLTIAIGDSIWWQHDKAYWSTRDESVNDRPIKRVGLAYDGDSPRLAHSARSE